MSISLRVSSNRFIFVKFQVASSKFKVKNLSFNLELGTYHSLSAADVREQFGRGALEEGGVEAAYDLFDVLPLDDEGQVDGGRALRDEQDVYVLDGREDAGGDAGRRAQALAHDADYRAPRLDLDGAYLLSLRDYLFERARSFERGRAGAFGSRDDVDGRAVPLEDLEDGAKEAVSAEHARRSDVD